MPVTTDYQIEVNSILMHGEGPGDYEVATVWPDFFRRAPRPADLDLLGDGVHFGITRSDAVEHSWDVEIIHATPATVQTRLMALRDAWVPDTTELHFQIGGVHYMMEGQPRLFRVDEQSRAFGRLLVAVSFVANPAITVVP